MHNIYANTYTTAVVCYTSLTHGSNSWPNIILISDRWVDYLNRFYLTINSILEQKILHVLFSHLKTEMPMYLAILLIHCYIKIIHILLFTFSTGSFLLFIVLKYKPADATISGEVLFYTLYVDQCVCTQCLCLWCQPLFDVDVMGSLIINQNKAVTWQLLSVLLMRFRAQHQGLCL